MSEKRSATPDNFHTNKRQRTIETTSIAVDDTLINNALEVGIDESKSTRTHIRRNSKRIFSKDSDGEDHTDGSASGSVSESDSNSSETSSDDDDDDDDVNDNNNNDNNNNNDDDVNDIDNRKSFSEKEQFELQSRYRNLNEELLKQRTKIALDGGVKMVSKSLAKADDLFARTKMGMEANIVAKDSFTLNEIGYQAKIATKSMKLGRSERLLNFDEFVKCFNSKFGDDNEDENGDFVSRRDELPMINWLKLGELATNLSGRAATCEFLLGPLELSKKQHQVRQRLHDDSRSSVIKTANSKNADDISKSQEADVTTKNSERLFRKLVSCGNHKVLLFSFFIDPHSFSKSVENLFYTSFLVNHDKVLFTRDEKTELPYIQQANRSTLAHQRRFLERDDSKSHIIMSIDYDTWKKLVKKYDIRKSFLES